MIKLVIFDLDGTLLNSLDDLAASTNHALEKNGYPAHETNAYKIFVGNGVNKLIERALPKNARINSNILKVREDFFSYYTMHQTDFTAPYEGINELLEELKNRNILLAVASNKYHTATNALVNSYFGKDFFDFIYGQREGVNPKPDPTVVFDILKEANVDKDNVLYIGDSDVDMQTAKNSNIISIGVTWGYRTARELKENGAVYTVDHPREILTIIDNLRE